MTQKHRVVIVGGGFGGLYAAKALRDDLLEVVLLDRHNFHLFQPLLYQLATGELSSADVAAPLRTVLARRKNVRVLLAEAVDFDLGRRAVMTAGGEVAYDTLVVAVGSVTNYFGHDEWRDNALGLKSAEDALELRRRIFFAFEQAEKELDGERQREWLTFVVAGAGATGVEMAGAIAEIARHTLRGEFRSINPADARIILLDALERPLVTFPERLSGIARRDLAKLGVEFLSGTVVTGMGPDWILLQPKDGPPQEIRARTVIWAAGVTGNPLGLALATQAGIKPGQGGRIPVSPDCTIAGHPEVFIIGDLALLPDPKTGKPLPGTAPVAMQQGGYVARLIVARVHGRTMPAFEFRDRGNLAAIGRHRAVAVLGKLQFSGLVAWLLWLFVHILYLVEFTARVVVLVRWGIQYLKFGRNSRAILRPAELARLASTADNRPRNRPAA